MKDLVYIKSLDTIGTVEAVWKDRSMYYVTPTDSLYGTWFLANDVAKISEKEYYKILWSLTDD